MSLGDEDAWNATDLDTDSKILTLQKEAEPQKAKTQESDDLAQLQMSAAFIVAEYVEARRDFLNSYEEWLISRKEIILELYQLSNELDKWKKGKDITQAAGSSMGLLGGSLTISGLILMPITAGTSTVLCAVGLGVGLTGGVTSLSGTIAEILADKNKVKIAQEQMQEDTTRTTSIVKAYETLKLCLFEANFTLARCKESKGIIEQKLADLEIKNSSFMPQGLIHTMKVEQINSALAANKISNEIRKQKEMRENGEIAKAEPPTNQVQAPLERMTSSEKTVLPATPNLSRKLHEDGTQIDEKNDHFDDEDSEEMETFNTSEYFSKEQESQKKLQQVQEENCDKTFLASSKKFLEMKTDKKIEFETNFDQEVWPKNGESVTDPSGVKENEVEVKLQELAKPTRDGTSSLTFEEQIKEYEINKQLTEAGLTLNSAIMGDKDGQHSDLHEASSSTDFARGSSLVLGTASSSNGVKEVLSKAVLPSLQVGQQLAVGLSSAFIVVDIYQLFTASRNLTRGSVSETAKVLRMKADQLLEQQLFFNQIYEYIR